MLTHAPTPSPLDSPRLRPFLRTSLGLLVLCTLSVAVRAPFLAVPMISDEGGYAYVARFWSPQYQLYRDIPFDRPQGIFLIYQVILRLIGEDIVAIRMGAALYNAVTAVAIFLLTRDALSIRAAWLATTTFALFSASPGIQGFYANGELFAVLPLVIAAHLTWRRRWALAGLVSGIAVVIKPIGVSGLLLTLGWMVLLGSGRGSFARATLAFAVAPLASLAHGCSVGCDHFWTSFTRMMFTVSIVATDGSLQLSQFVDGVRRTTPALLVPGTLAVLGALRVSPAVRGFGLLWVGVSLIGMSIGASWFPHYFVQLVPPLSFLAGGAVLVSWRLLLAPVVLAAVVFLRVEGLLWTKSPAEVSWTLFRRPSELWARDVAAYVAASTTPDDPIYVAFAEAQVYYLAGRRAAIPQLYWYEIDLSPEIFAQVIEAIRNRMPTVIVWVNGPPPRRMTTAKFRALLEPGYREERRFDFIRVYRRKAVTG
jgi:hypothetical protein